MGTFTLGWRYRGATMSTKVPGTSYDAAMSARQAGVRPLRGRGLWGNAAFMLLWFGQSTSAVGTRVSTLAIPLTAIVVLGATPFEVGLLRALTFVPYLLFALVAGVWVDRRRRRPILVVADLTRALLLATIPAAALIGRLSMVQLLLVAFLVGVAACGFDVAYRAYLPVLVSREQLVEGNSKLQLTRAAAGTIGPGLGGALVQLLSAPVAVLADSASFLVSAASLAVIRRREPAPSPTNRSVRKDLAEGLRITFGNRVLRAQVSSVATFNFFVSMGGAVSILFLTRGLGFSSLVTGLLLSCGAPGAVIGSLAARHLSARFGIGRACVAASFVNGLGAAMLPVAPTAGGIGAALVIAAVFLMGLGNQVVNVTVISIRQIITPSRMLGRVNASSQFLTYGVAPLGAVAGGVLGSAAGLRGTLVVAAAGCLTAFLWLLLSPVRGLQRPVVDSLGKG